MSARESLSLTAAGLLVAAFTGAMAVSTPLLARTVDRWRQPPVLWASALVSGAGYVLVAAGGHRIPTAVLGAVLAGLGTPPLEACLRALWPDLLPPGGGARRVRAGHRRPGSDLRGRLTTAALRLAGTAVFAATPAVRSWRGIPAVRHWAGPLRSHRLALMLTGVACVGLAFGSLPVAVTAYAEAAGNRSLSGWLLAAQATGALLGGLLYTRTGQGGPGRLPLLAGALTAGFLPLLVMPQPVPMAVLLAVCGVPLPPLLTAVFLTADRLAPAGTVTEAFAWVATAFAVGSAGGAALAGPVVATGLRYGFLLAPAAALVSVAVLAIVSRTDPAP